MSFVPKSFEEIRDLMLGYVRMHTQLTDFEVGSVIRTIIEAAALSDDDQYFQMVQLLEAFKLSTSSGQDLDNRVQEFDVIRLQPASATVSIKIFDGALTKDSLNVDAASGITSLVLADSSEFPTAGYPYTVRVGEGTISVEDVSVTLNTLSSNTLSLAAATTKAHSFGDRVAVVAGADRSLPSSLRVQVPAAGTKFAIVFVTTEQGTIVAGDYESTPIRAKAEFAGTGGNIGIGQISEFATTAPFTGALVTNTVAAGGGRDLETDAQLRDRAKSQIQS